MKHLFARKWVFLSVGVLAVLGFIVASPMLSSATQHPDECTSWVALGDAVGGGKTILHKNRDLSDDDPDNHQFRNVKTGLYKYIAMGDDKVDDDLYVWGGINDTGLACASNLGNGAYLGGTIGGPSSCREILENCNTVECGYQWLSDNKSKFFYECIVFLANAQKGAVVEIGLNSLGTMSITTQAESVFDANTTVAVTGKKGLNFRSNHFKIRTNYFGYSTNSGDRFDRLMATLAKTPAEGGLYGTINFSNSQWLGSQPATADKQDAICRTSTLGRMTFAIDSANPLNSMMYHGNGYGDSDGDGNDNLCDQNPPDEYPLADYFSKGKIVPYTFVGIQPSDTKNNIYACDVDQFPFGGNAANLNSKTEATATYYTNVSLPDSLVWTTAKPGTGDEMMMWVERTISEAPVNIDRIDFVFQGYPGSSKDFKIYVKTAAGAWQNDSSWTQLGTAKSFTAGKNKSIRRSLDSASYNIANYVDSTGKVTWMVGAPSGDNVAVTANVIKMEVILK